MHPRVVNVLHKGAEWDVYVGRGRCPCSLRPCPHQVRVIVDGLNVRIDWSNPYPIDAYGPDCMRLFLENVAPQCVAQARLYLPGLRLACWCRGRYPFCHAEVWARLADGEELAAIRADVLARLSPEQTELFGGARG